MSVVSLMVLLAMSMPDAAMAGHDAAPAPRVHASPSTHANARVDRRIDAARPGLPFVRRRKAKLVETKRLAPLELVDRRLRDLVAQQESWFVREGRYTRDAYRAGQARRGHDLAFAEVQVSVLYAGRNGWSAVASHPSAPGRTCVAFVGAKDRLPIVPRTHTDGRDAMFEGIPACDAR